MFDNHKTVRLWIVPRSKVIGMTPAMISMSKRIDIIMVITLAGKNNEAHTHMQIHGVVAVSDNT